MPARWLPTSGTIQDTAWDDDAGVQITPIPVRGALDLPSELQWSAKAIRGLLGDFHPDLVQIEVEPWTPAAVTTIAAARRLKIPVILTTRESLPRSLGLMERIRRDRALHRAQGMLAANAIAATLVTNQRADLRLAVVPLLGVTPPTLRPREPHEALAIGFVGRLVPERGLDLLFRACVPLSGRWTITVVGTGPSQEELESLAERLGIAARVSWLGALPRRAIDDVWPTLDCLAAPSRSTERWIETQCRAPLEAMAHGLPVVASSSGALPDIIGDGGRIVPEDDVPALTAALEELLHDHDLRSAFGTTGRRRVMEQFSDSAVARRTLDFWRESLALSLPGDARATA